MTDDEEEIRQRFAEYDAQAAASSERWIENLGLEGAVAERFRDHGRHWILIDRELVAVGLLEWGRWFEDPGHRRVGNDDVVGPDGKTYEVSTVFLGLDHGFGPFGPPLVFETMIFERHEPRTQILFGREYQSERTSVDSYQRRYATLAEAEAGHELAMADVLNGNWDPYDDD